MATIRKLPSGKWNVLVRVKGEPTKSVTRATRLECEQWLAEYEGINSKGATTVDTLITDYLNDVMIRDGKERGGYNATKFRLFTIARTLDNKPLEELEREDAVSYRQERVKHVSGSTVRLEMQLLSRFLRWANIEKGVACTDIVEGVKLPDPGKARDRVVTELEYKMILDRVSDKAKPAVVLAWETAMRRGEILSITPKMIDFKKRVIHLSEDQTKNGEARDVPLSTVAYELLKQLCDGRDSDSPLIGLTGYALTQAWRRGARLAGIYGTVFHSLRHTCITRYAEKGLSTMQLQAISGHRSISMLARYSHIRASSIVDLMD